ncbi:hypothetical protein DFJ77DRAFT_208480 [Powellomyces hirtus]|nr:hypothetical protein DFJ77DRAFT_208480 [Powellomyces hirtus]
MPSPAHRCRIRCIACLGNSGAANITSIVQVAIDIVAGIPALVGPPGCEANPITCTYYTPGLYTFDFMDTTTLADGGITYWKHFVDANGKLLPADVQEALFDAILATNNTGYITYFAGPDPTVKSKYIYESPNFYDPFQDPNYMYMQGPTSGKEIDRRWNVGLLGSSLYGSVTRNAYDTPYHPKPSHNCQAGGSVTTSLNPFLQANVPSENGVVFLFDTSPQNDTTPKLAPGPMIASSVPGSDISSGYPAKRYAVTSSPSPIVAQVGKFLVSQYSDLRMSGLQTFKTKFDDGKYYYVATMRVTPDTNGAVWQLVVAFPRDDFFKAIDSSINKSIVVIASLSVAGLLLVLCMSFAFTIPLRKLSLRMGEVTQMKFSSLQNGGLEARSLIKEISNLEDTFHIMVQAFASGIKKNQSIVAGKSMAASALSSGPTKKLGSTSE